MLGSSKIMHAAARQADAGAGPYGRAFGFARLPAAVQQGLITVVAALVTLTAAIVLAPLGESLVDDWSRRDVEMRSTLVFNSLGGPLAQMLANNRRGDIEDLFERVATDTRVVGVAFCRGSEAPDFASKLMPSSLACKQIARSDTPSFSSLAVDGHPVLIAAFPISTRENMGHFIIVHDLTFAQKRGLQARNHLAIVLVAVTAASGVLALGLVFFILRRWLRQFRRALGMGQADKPLAHINDEVHALLRQIDDARAAISTDTVQWNQQTLRKLVGSQLPDADVIVVANREPYIHNWTEAGVKLQTPASGLVSALEPVMRACGGTWIAHGSGSADRETVDARDHVQVPIGNPEYTLRRIWISEEEQDGYYYGLANEGLWPLCHIAFTRPVFRQEDWEMYRAINERFADAVTAEARTSSPLVLIQDYHFALLPRMVRQRLPDATIVTFWHIPWPNSETFGIIPWKAEIIRGLLGSSVLGFHTQFHCNNFLETVDRFVESRIDREASSVTLGGEETFVRPYPISIEWPHHSLSKQESIDRCRASVLARHDLPADIKLAVGIERFDYTKGVLDRMRAVESMLKAHPQWRGKFVMLQAAAPTRTRLATYKTLQDEAIQLAHEINARFADCAIPPIKLVIRHHDPDEVFQLFRACNVCIVSSLHDGMNLVAKEFVAARDDEAGVLLLSSFAGASRELAEALIINPYDGFSTGEALHQALTMPLDEQRARMRLMRTQVSQKNVYRWAGQMLLDAAALQKRKRFPASGAHAYSRKQV